MAEDRTGFIDSYAAVGGVLHDAVCHLAIRCTAVEINPLPLRGHIGCGKEDLLAFRANSSQSAEHFDLEVPSCFDAYARFDNDVLQLQIAYETIGRIPQEQGFIF